MADKIQILDRTTHTIIGEIEVESAYVYEKVNDKYTFDFTCYEQKDVNMLAQQTLIYADNDYFRIENVSISPVEGKYEVSCEHISYELNVITKEEEEEEAEDLIYEGKVWDIMNEILDGTEFVYVHSDDINDTFHFVTRQKGKRSRILEFCVQNKFEAHWYGFQLSIQFRRGHDNGLEIELGQNLRDLTINKRFHFNGEIETTYDVDFIDLNKILDENGNPLRNVELHLGDTVYLKYKNQTVSQRAKAVGYNPFKKVLPTVELESPVRDITEVIADGAISSGSPSTNGAIMETASGAFSSGKEFRFTKPYDNLYSVTVSITKPSTEANVYYSVVQNTENKYVGVKVWSVESLSGVKVSVQAIVR